VTEKLGINEPGGVRPMKACWVVTVELVLESAVHFGGRGDDLADMMLLLDPRESCPLLPGSSLAGALRSHLADVLGGYYSAEDGRVATLFGAVRTDDKGSQSPLIVFDSLGILPAEHHVEIRDGVQIDPGSGVAEDHKKFDFEILPAGTRFSLRFDLVVSGSSTEGELISLLATSLSGLAPNEISLGARRSRGFGIVRAKGWRAFRFDLTSAQGWMQWLISDSANPMPSDVVSSVDLPSALRGARPGHELNGCEDKRRRTVIEAKLSLTGGMLIRSAPPGPNAPDAAHLKSAGRSILAGTSLAGVLRGRALRIAHVVRSSQGDAPQWVERLFGQKSLAASRLRVTESAIENGTRLRPSRIQIDRFTQGVLPGALFDEEPEYGGKLTVRFELRKPEPGEAGLLFLVLKDLLSGELPVGGTSSVGRGLLRGRARARLDDSTLLDLDVDQPADHDVELINRKIHEFATSPSPVEVA